MRRGRTEALIIPPAAVVVVDLAGPAATDSRAAREEGCLAGRGQGDGAESREDEFGEWAASWMSTAVISR